MYKNVSKWSNLFCNTGDYHLNLTMELIRSSVVEYRKILTYFVKHPESKWKNNVHTDNEINRRKRIIIKRNELEFFFGSDWFEILTPIPAEVFIKEIWKEVGYNAEYKAEL